MKYVIYLDFKSTAIGGFTSIRAVKVTVHKKLKKKWSFVAFVNDEAFLSGSG